MSRLLIQEALRNGVSLQTIEDRMHVYATRHKTLPNLVLFKYDQIESPFAKLFVRQCRGLILDESDSWAVVSRPFDKFFNHGERLAAPIDWRTARVLEKLDGSLIQMYWYGGEWHVGTSGTPDASGGVNGHPYTFRTLFWETWAKAGYQVPNPVWQGVTFLFELCTPYNRIVVKHEKPRIWLIGARETDGSEHQTNELHTRMAFGSFPVPAPLYPDLTNFDHLAIAHEGVNPLDHEGFVVVDREFNRVKVKHPGYVALHHAVSSLSQRALVNVVRNGEALEVLQSFPEWGEKFASILDAYNRLGARCLTAYEAVRKITDQKDYALAVKDMDIAGILFARRKGVVIAQSLRTMHIDKLIHLMDLPMEAGIGNS